MPNPTRSTLEKVPVILPSTNAQANIHTVTLNTAEVITYPTTGDAALDAEAFRKWQFIRLPEELGGAAVDISAFRVYSMICLHYGACGITNLKIIMVHVLVMGVFMILLMANQ